MSQLKKLHDWVARRRNIAARYDIAFADIEGIKPLAVRGNVHHAYHLYVVRTGMNEGDTERTKIFKALHEYGIGVNVHYIPVHLHPFYRNKFKIGPGLCPVAEAAYQSILSLPMFPAMSDADVSQVIESITKVVRSFA